MKTAKTHIFEIEELACQITGLDYDEIDADTEIIENKLMDVLGIDLPQLQEVVERLMPLIYVGFSPLTKRNFKGFASDGNWFTKVEI